MDSWDPLAQSAAAEQPGDGPGSGKLLWYLAGFLVLSGLAWLVVLVVYQPSDPGARGSRSSPAPGSSLPPVTGQQLTAGGSPDWVLRLYYTATETYYRGGPAGISGCADPSCGGGRVGLGSYPSDFLAAVRVQGSGRVSSGPYAGAYLNWDSAVGYWLDRSPREFTAGPLHGFVSAQSGTPMLSARTPIKVLSCGVASRPGAGPVCARLKATSWNVVAVARTSAQRVIRLYVGLERGPGFAASPWASTFRHAVIRIG
jgi:hypothetical protein